MRLTVDVQIEGPYETLPQEEIEKIVLAMSQASETVLPGGKVRMHLVRIHPKMGMLVYYMKVPAPAQYNEPTEAQFEDFRTLPGASVGEAVTYEQFKALCKMSYEQAVKNGFGLTVQTKAAEYTDDAHLEQIKEDIRGQEGFVAFPEDPVLNELIVPIEEMIKTIKDIDENKDTQQ